MKESSVASPVTSRFGRNDCEDDDRHRGEPDEQERSELAGTRPRHAEEARTDGGERFARGDRVVLIEHLESDNTYRVISETAFHQQ